MKAIFLIGLIYVFISSTVIAAQPKFRIPRLTSTGLSKYPVVAQTAPELIEKNEGRFTFRRFYLTRWASEEKYEYGYALYICKEQKCELFGDAIALQFYDSCKGFKKNGKPQCERIVSTRIDVVDPLEEPVATQRTWYSCEDYGSNCRVIKPQGDKHENSH